MKRSTFTIAKVSNIREIAPKFEDASEESLDEDERLEENDEHILLTEQLDQALDDPFGHLDHGSRVLAGMIVPLLAITHRY